MYDLNREGLSAVAGDVSIGIDHYAVQGGVALAITALAFLLSCFRPAADSAAHVQV